ncbi:MAG: fructose-6-phosphate aldolase, partial [Candidatus Magasanikbacteria bacterium]|nr:fructose-6-phosphate aldolase [Candidatus Magasanikbacteria bacterium]
MKLFIDSANLEEIKIASSWGVIDDVTTNPTLIAKEGGGLEHLKQRILEICQTIDGPVSVEAISLSTDEMIKEAQEFSSWHRNIAVKIPCLPEGLKAVVLLSKMKIKTNVTRVFSLTQVLLAAKAGADFISPFVGRLDDAGQEG